MVEHLLAHDPGALLVAQFDELIVGTAIAAWDGWRGHIYRLVVLPEYRLRGVGRRLVASGHERLRALGATTVNAAVGQHEPGPIAFWLAIGYHRDPGMSRFAKTL
jgi:GNAT superfamily N-acetyltransferase